MSDQQLMQSIFSSWQAAIETAIAGTLVPAELVAALVANESGGNADAKRFEPAVFGELCEVLAGKRTAYKPAGISRPLMASDLLPFVAPALDEPAVTAATLGTIFTQSLGRVAELATSYSLLQIMGWHWIEFNRPASMLPAYQLMLPAYQLAFGVVLLVYFANKYTLDLTTDAAKLFSCWNTGEPGGKTFDPNYVPNGLARLELYRSIAGSSAT